MNWNAGFFPAFNHRRKPPLVSSYRLPAHYNHASILSTSHASESFLPSIGPVNGRDEGHRPYRRNDFANNHLFVTKQRLAQVILEQPTLKARLTNDSSSLSDEREPKASPRRVNRTKRQAAPSVLDHNAHLSVINLFMKPSMAPATNGKSPAVKLPRPVPTRHHSPRAPRSSMQWINPIMKQTLSSVSPDDDTLVETSTAGSTDRTPTDKNATINPFQSSLLYIKSILPANESSVSTGRL